MIFFLANVMDVIRILRTYCVYALVASLTRLDSINTHVDVTFPYDLFFHANVMDVIRVLCTYVC